jgi:hypothetical protein
MISVDPRNWQSHAHCWLCHVLHAADWSALLCGIMSNPVALPCWQMRESLTCPYTSRPLSWSMSCSKRSAGSMAMKKHGEPHMHSTSPRRVDESLSNPIKGRMLLQETRPVIN